ncbi:MAG: efflux RND transporter periplasmic adaptor subunit [Rikenellaceae bacterium]
MSKTFKWIIVAVIVLVAGYFFYNQTKPKQAEILDTQAKSQAKSRSKSRALNVNAVVLKPTLMVDEFSTTGVLIPDESVDLIFETFGKIVELNFEEGSHVKKGDVLAQINDNYLVAQRDRLTSQLKLAQDRVYRQGELLQRDAVSKEALEMVQTDLAILQADIEIIDAQIERTKLFAPFDGVIGLRQVSLGAYANQNTVVATLTRNQPLKVEFAIPERYSNYIGRGANLTFSVEGEMQDFEAQVYATESLVDKSLHQFSLRAIYPNEDGRLMSGRFVQVKLKKDEIKDAIAIPAHAIVPEMGVDKVFLYKNGKAEPYAIETGLRTDDAVQVLKGLNIGDTLIVSGTLQLRTGIAVSLDKID